MVEFIAMCFAAGVVTGFVAQALAEFALALVRNFFRPGGA